MISKTINYLIKKNILDETNKEVYQYGLFVLLFNLLNIFSVIFIGFLLNQTLLSIVFLLSFIPIRVLAGGFHFKSAFFCCIFFNFCLFVFLLLSRFLIYPPKPLIIICILSLTISTYFEYKSRLRVLIPLYFILLIELYLILNYSHLKIMFYAILYNTFLYFLQKIINLYKSNKSD